MTALRLLLVFALAALAALAELAAESPAGPADPTTATGSPTDLEWLRGEVGDGALVHHADGHIYLTELATGDTVHVSTGEKPEFSPDGSKFVWLDRHSAYGRMRRDDGTMHRIADDVLHRGGIHWLSNSEVVMVIQEEGRRPKWYRISLAGDRAPVPELTRMGVGGYECDVKRGSDGVWSYVAKRHWATSDGRRGRVAGTCSVSLSPDGRSVTSLHEGHMKLSIEAIRPGGAARTVRWPYPGGFDNQRWASNDERFVVLVDEVDQESLDVTYPVVMKADGSRSTRMGNRGYARHGVYGDFVVGDGRGGSWLGEERRESPR